MCHNSWMLNLCIFFIDFLDNVLLVEYLFFLLTLKILYKTKTGKVAQSPFLPLLDSAVRKGYTEYIKTNLSHDKEKGFPLLAHL